MRHGRDQLRPGRVLHARRDALRLRSPSLARCRWRPWRRSPPRPLSARRSSCWPSARSPATARCASSWSPSAARWCCASWPCTSSAPTSGRSRRSRQGASLKAFGVAVELQTLWIWGLTALAVVVLALLYRKTTFGRAMRATAIRRDAARLVGINAGVMVTVAFALAAGLGALAGVAVAPLTQTAFGVGAVIGVKGFAAAILGGIGNPVSAVAGGLLLGLLESFAGRLPRPGLQGRRRSRRAARRALRRAAGPARQGRARQGVMNARTLRALAPLVAVARRAGRAAAGDRPLHPQGLHLRRHQRPGGRRARAALRLRRAGLARARRLHGARRLHQRVLHGRARVAVAARVRRRRRAWPLSAASSSPSPACACAATTSPWRRSRFGLLMSLAFTEAEPLTGGVDGFTGIPFPSIGPIEFRSASSLYWLVWGAVGIAVLVAHNITSMRPGRAMRALHGSELGAQACGVDIVGVKVRTFVVSALLAGLAGALYAGVVGFVSPSVFTLHRVHHLHRHDHRRRDRAPWRDPSSPRSRSRSCSTSTPSSPGCRGRRRRPSSRTRRTSTASPSSSW